MKILFLTHSFYPENNGIAMVNDYMARGLQKNNSVVVVTEKKDGLDAIYNDEYNYEGIQIYRISVKQKGFRFVGDRKRLFELIHKEAPDVLICVCVQTWTFDFIAPVLDEIKCRKILYNHGASAYFDDYPLLSSFITFRLNAFKYYYYWKQYYNKAYKYIQKFDRVIYLSEDNSAYRYAKKYGINNGIVIENAVEDDFFDFKRENNILDKEFLSFIYVSNYDDNKNQKALLNAFYSSLMKYSDVSRSIRLTMIGGQDKEYYKELCELNEYKKSELTKIKGNAFAEKISIELFFGLERSEIKECMKVADIFLMGSKKEQYPIVLCEAAASGLMIISTNVGHASTIPGCIVVKDYAEMAGKISEVLYEPSIVYEKGQKAREYALKHYRIKEKVKELDKVIKGEI